MTPLVLVGIALGAAVVGGIVVGALLGRRPPLPPGGEGLGKVFEDFGNLKGSVSMIASAQEAIRSSLTGLADSVRSVETRVEERIGGVRDRIQAAEVKLVEEAGATRLALQGEIQGARQSLSVLHAQAEERRRLTETLRDSTQRIEAIVAGGAGKGRAGENILREAFRCLPPEMIQFDFRVGGKPVEFALVLANGKRLPVDSKWPASDLLDRIAGTSDPAERDALVDEVERTVRKRTEEIAQYVDPASTVPLAVGALPDAVFALLKRVHAEAYRRQVLLVPYSLALPFLLAFFRLHLDLARSVDLETLEGSLDRIAQRVGDLEVILENKVTRGATMVQNAYAEIKKVMAEIQGAVAAVRTLPSAPAGRPAGGSLPPAPDQGGSDHGEGKG